MQKTGVKKIGRLGEVKSYMYIKYIREEKFTQEKGWWWVIVIVNGHIKNWDHEKETN